MPAENPRAVAADRQGRPLRPGDRVRIVGEEGDPQGQVVRVLADYGVATVLIEQKNQRVERMYPLAELERLAAAE